MFADEIFVSLLEKGDRNPTGNAGANGDERRLGAEGSAANDGDLRGGDHGGCVFHGYVAVFMDAFDGVGEVAGEAEHLDRVADEEGAHEADDGDPEPVVRRLPAGGFDDVFGDGLPQEFEEILEDHVVAVGGHAAEDADDGRDDDGDGYGTGLEIGDVGEECAQSEAIVHVGHGRTVMLQ